MIRVGFVPERIKNKFRVNWIMFHWICPECGREIPPRLKECPSCDPQAAPVVHALEAVVKGAAEAATQEPAPVGNVAANDAAASVADSLAATLKEIPRRLSPQPRLRILYLDLRQPERRRRQL